MQKSKENIEKSKQTGYTHFFAPFSNVCRFIEEIYQKAYGAQIKCGYDEVLMISNHLGYPLAAIGIRNAVNDCYLESYLDKPIEVIVSELYQQPATRSSIVEVGNFAGINSRAALLLMQGLCCYVVNHHYSYMVMTCTSKLSRQLQGLPIKTITAADANRIANVEQWGSYYHHQPNVIVGKLASYDQRFNKYCRNSDLQLVYLNRSGAYHDL